MKESRCKVLRCKVAMCLSMVSADELDDDTSTILGLSKEYRLVGVVDEGSDVFEIDDLSVFVLERAETWKEAVCSALDGKVLVICLEHDDALPERHKKFSDKLQFLGAIRGHPWIEFKNSTFDNHLGEKGTKRELTVHDNHGQFGVLGRFSRTKPELERAMLIDAGLP